MASLKIPLPGVQHTRAIVALTLAQVCMDQFQPENDNDVSRHIGEICAAITACARGTKKKKISAGTKRALDNFFDILVKQFGQDITDPDKLFARWASLVWCASHFLTDVLATCPKYAKGPNQNWHKLRRLMNELADGLLEIDPAADERGTRIYLESFCAMDGCEYVPEEYA